MIDIVVDLCTKVNYVKNSELVISSPLLALQILVWQHPFRGRHCRVSRSLICGTYEVQATLLQQH